MAPDIPSGYITRPNAAKLFNRAQRSLERDLEDAQINNKEDVLNAFQLVTDNGKVHEAQSLTPTRVKELQNEGLNPVWCVEITWLEETYGRKGEPRPKQESVTEKVKRPD